MGVLGGSAFGTISSLSAMFSREEGSNFRVVLLNDIGLKPGEPASCCVLRMGAHGFLSWRLSLLCNVNCCVSIKFACRVFELRCQQHRFRLFRNFLCDRGVVCSAVVSAS